jgi:heat shock protein HslJ
VVEPGGSDLPVSGDGTFKIENGKLQASDTCNTLSGDAVLTGHQLDTKNIATTAVGCTGAVAATAAVIDNVLTGSALVEQRFTQLTVSRQGVGTLEYAWVPENAAASDPGNLTNRTWYLTSLAGDPVVDGVTLQIDGDGTTTGYDGCRKFTAKATLGDGTLDFGQTLPSYQPGPAEPGCNNPDIATTVDTLLSLHPALWHIADGNLVINGFNAQAFAMVLQEKNPNPPPTAPSLAGTAWTLTTIENGSGPNGTASSVVTDVTVRFDLALVDDRQATADREGRCRCPCLRPRGRPAFADRYSVDPAKHVDGGLEQRERQLEPGLGHRSDDRQGPVPARDRLPLVPGHRGRERPDDRLRQPAGSRWRRLPEHDGAGSRPPA